MPRDTVHLSALAAAVFSLTGLAAMPVAFAAPDRAAYDDCQAKVFSAIRRGLLADFDIDPDPGFTEMRVGPVFHQLNDSGKADMARIVSCFATRGDLSVFRDFSIYDGETGDLLGHYRNGSYMPLDPALLR